MKTAVILNPIAGRGKSFKKWADIKQELIAHEVAFQAFFTEKQGHALELTRWLQKKGYSQLLVAGGDGTLHEVINGLDLSKDITIGVIPTGTGNDFARSIKPRLDVKQAVKIIAQGKSKLIDLGQVNDKRFINISGVGFDAEIAKEVNTKLRFVKGRLAYLFALVKVLALYKCRPVDIYVNGGMLTKNILFLAVANAPYVGGGMKIVPDAVINDGVFHICLAFDTSKLDILSTLPRVYNGSHISHPKVMTIKADEVKLVSKYPFAVHADGELIGTLPATFKLLPQVLKVFVPGDGDGK